MSENRIIINSATSARSIARFFNELGDNQRVRARTQKDGNIELYVRENSFVQFFTDKLRLSSDVKKDYSAARDLINEIMGGRGTQKINTSHLKTKLAGEHHDFRASEIKQIDIINLAESVFKHNISAENIHDSWERTDHSLKNSVTTWDDQKLTAYLKQACPKDDDTSRRQIDSVVNFVADRVDLKSSLIWDESAIEDFADKWVSAAKEGKLTPPDPSLAPAIALINQFLDRIYSSKIPRQIDLEAGKIGESPADWIAFDQNSGFSDYDKLDITDQTIGIKNTVGPVVVTQHKVHADASPVQIGGLLKISTPNKIPDQAACVNVYRTLFTLIHQMHQDQSTQTTKPNTIHIPLLEISGSSGDEKARLENESIEAFVFETRNFLAAHPEITIKVQLPPNITPAKIAAAYRKAGTTFEKFLGGSQN